MKKKIFICGISTECCSYSTLIQNKKDFEAKNSKPKSQTRKKVTDKQRKEDGDKIQSKTENNESRKPKVDKVKKNITDKDSDKIQVNNKQKPSERDTKESHKVENKLSLGTKSPHAFATGNNHSKTKVDLVFCTKLVYNDNNGFSEIHASLVDLSQRTLPQITRWRDEQKKDKNGEVKNNNGFSTLEVAKHDAHIVTPVFGSTRPAVKFTYPCLLYTSPSPRDRQKSRMPSSA